MSTATARPDPISADQPQRLRSDRGTLLSLSLAMLALLAGNDAVTLATDIVALDQEQFLAAFRKSPMKRAKLVGPRRNAAIVLENAGP